MFNRKVENVSKKEGLTRKGWMKNRLVEGVATLKETMQLLTVFPDGEEPQ